MSDEEAPSPRGRRTWIKKKTKRRIAFLLVAVIVMIFYRGLFATTKNNFNCDYSILYAVCAPKFKNAEFPGLWEIMRTGVDF